MMIKLFIPELVDWLAKKQWSKLIPYLTFFLGIIISGAISRMKERRKLKSIKNYVLLWLNQILLTVELQKAYVKKYSELFSNYDLEDFSFHMVQKIYSDQILNISSTDLSNAFAFKVTGNKKNNEEMLLILNLQLDYAKRQTENIKKLWELFSVDHNKNKDKWNQNLKQLLDVINKFNLETKNREKDEFFNGMVRIVMEYKNNSPVEINNNVRSFTLKNLISPLEKLITEKYKKEIDEKCVELVKTVIEQTEIQKQLIALFNIMNKSYKEHEETLSTVYSDLNKCKKHIEKLKIKQWWNPTF